MYSTHIHNHTYLYNSSKNKQKYAINTASIKHNNKCGNDRNQETADEFIGYIRVSANKWNFFSSVCRAAGVFNQDYVS